MLSRPFSARLRASLLAAVAVGGGVAAGEASARAPESARAAASAPGLRGEYFDRADLTARRLVRADATVDFRWGTRGPGGGVGADSFSARWRGYVTPSRTGRYTFAPLADDGARLWVDGRQLVEAWAERRPGRRRGSIALTAGRRYALRLEYHDVARDAVMRLRWSGPGTPLQAIPAGRLTHDASASAAPAPRPAPDRPAPVPAPGPAPAPAPTPRPALPANPPPTASPPPLAPAPPTPALPPAVPQDLSVPVMDARPAADFVDSIGVNVHTNYNGWHYYEDIPRVANILADIGIRHVRDGHQGNRQDQFDRLNYLADRGIRSTLIEDPRADPRIPGDTPVGRHEGPEDPSRYGRRSLEHRIGELRAGKIRGVVALEGANEYNTERDFGDPQWVPTIVSAQRRLKELNDASLRLPLLGPSFTNWQAYEEARRGGLGPYVPIGNIHPYPGGKPPSSGGGGGTLAWHVWEEVDRLAGRPGAPWQATETGYHTAVNQWWGHRPASERAAGVYAPKLFLEYFRQGGQRTFWYEMIDGWEDPERDEQEANFGLVRQDWSYKPAGESLKALIAALTRPGPAAPGSLRYQVLAAPDDLQQLLLRRGDGSYALALWRDVSVWDEEAHRELSPGPAAVRLKLGAPADLEVSTVGRRAAPTRARAQTLSAEVPADDTVIVGIG